MSNSWTLLYTFTKIILSCYVMFIINVTIIIIIAIIIIIINLLINIIITVIVIIGTFSLL